MKIETKFNIDDEVFFLSNNKLYKNKILSINIYVKCEKTHIEYWMELSKEITRQYVKEEEVFATKEDLLKSL